MPSLKSFIWDFESCIGPNHGDSLHPSKALKSSQQLWSSVGWSSLQHSISRDTVKLWQRVKTGSPGRTVSARGGERGDVLSAHWERAREHCWFDWKDGRGGGASDWFKSHLKNRMTVSNNHAHSLSPVSMWEWLSNTPLKSLQNSFNRHSSVGWVQLPL